MCFVISSDPKLLASQRLLSTDLGVGVVVSPELADLLLASHIPHGEGHALHRAHGLHIETDGGDGTHILVQLYLWARQSDS